MRAVARRLAADRRGATLVEFAMISPVLLLALMGMFDLGYNLYTNALLQGSIQKAARNSTIEGAGGAQAAIDDEVSRAVRALVPNSTMAFSRKAYSDFSDVGRPEDFSDVDGDGTCNDGEPFEDANGNGRWDANRGNDGFGGARDAVLYEVRVNYPRPFPLWRLVGQPETFTMTARTVLRNQPYALPEDRSATGNCT